jgi:predicted amidohydrolase YtcJ
LPEGTRSVKIALLSWIKLAYTSTGCKNIKRGFYERTCFTQWQHLHARSFDSQSKRYFFRSGRIAAIGSDEQVRTASTNAEFIDLEGRVALPGLTDAHFHFYDWSFSRRNLVLSDVSSFKEVQQRVTEDAKTKTPEKWILGQGWNETRWSDQILPNRAALDTAAPENPCILWRSDLHLAVVNSRALEIAGITASTRNPSGGVIDRDPSGQPTGVLRELAINLVTGVIPQPSEKDEHIAMKEAIPALHQLGLTGLHDFRIMGGPEGRQAFKAYQHLRAQGELPLRLWMHIPLERLEHAIALGLKTGFGDDFLQVGHVKLFSDGSQGARTAWMLEPYQDVDHAGMPLTPMDEIAQAVYQADRAGLAVAVHAIGDRAVRELIGVFEEVLQNKTASSPTPSAPHRIEHVQNIRPDDLARLAPLGVIASVQPIHATDDMPMLEQSVGERSRFCYAFKDMLKGGHHARPGLRLSGCRPQSISRHPCRCHPPKQEQPARRGLVPGPTLERSGICLGIHHGTGNYCRQGQGSGQFDGWKISGPDRIGPGYLFHRSRRNSWYPGYAYRPGRASRAPGIMLAIFSLALWRQ